MEKELIVTDVVVIGAGPAGMTAALYASRANLKTHMIEKGVPGGEVNNTADVENYPGFSLVSGPELAQHMYQGAMRFDAVHDYGDVSHIEVVGDLKRVHTSSKVYEAKAVIVTTGSFHRHLGVPGEEELAGRGVSYCAVCDGFFFRDKEIIVVGGGDSAVEEAHYLTQFASKVTVIHRRDELRAQKVLQDRAFANPKIEFIWDSVVEEILGTDAVEGVQIKNVKTGQTSRVDAQGVFIYVGLVPNSEAVKDLGITDQEGWIITDDHMATSLPGVFAAGDVRQKHLRQIVTATGDGGTAGFQAYQYIETLKD